MKFIKRWPATLVWAFVAWIVIIPLAWLYTGWPDTPADQYGCIVAHLLCVAVQIAFVLVDKALFHD